MSLALNASNARCSRENGVGVVGTIVNLAARLEVATGSRVADDEDKGQDTETSDGTSKDVLSRELLNKRCDEDGTDTFCKKSAIEAREAHAVTYAWPTGKVRPSDSD